MISGAGFWESTLAHQPKEVDTEGLPWCPGSCPLHGEWGQRKKVGRAENFWQDACLGVLKLRTTIANGTQHGNLILYSWLF